MAAVKSLKMIVIGPASSGKSVLANFLVDQVDLTKVPYNPTKGVRILEADVSSGTFHSYIIGSRFEAAQKNAQNKFWKENLKRQRRREEENERKRSEKDFWISHGQVKETSSDGGNKSAPQKHIPIQLWEAGGQSRTHWNTLLYSADAAIVVYNADRAGGSGQAEKDLETLLYFFHERPHSAVLKPIPESRILILAHHHKSLSRSRFANVSALPPEFSEKSDWWWP